MMFSNISYYNKLRLTGIAGIFLLIVCYTFAFKKTLSEYSLYHQKVGINSKAAFQANSFQQLTLRNQQINKVINPFFLDTLNPSRNLLAIASKYSNENNLNLIEYKPLDGIGKGEYSTLTRSVVVEGSFVDCLGLVYELEMHQKIGRVSSVKFLSYHDPRNKQIKLTCTIFIQNIIFYNE